MSKLLDATLINLYLYLVIFRSFDVYIIVENWNYALREKNGGPAKCEAKRISWGRGGIYVSWSFDVYIRA